MTRWGVLGAGTMGQRIAAALHGLPGSTVAAAAATDPARAAGLYPARVHGTYRDLLDDPAVDVVYVSLGNAWHLQWVAEALAAGKHVLCEKPLGITAAEVEQLQTAADAAGRLLVEAHWWRHHPRTRAWEAALPALGTVRHVGGGFTFDAGGSGAAGVGTARGRRPGGWRGEAGGGAMLDVGCYPAMAAVIAFGGAPTSVAARGTFVDDVDTALEVVAEWPSGEADLVGSFTSSAGQWLVVGGDGGELELPAPVFTAERHDPVELWWSPGDGTTVTRFDPVETYALMLRDVATVVVGGSAFVTPPADSLAVARLMDAALTSARAGGEVVDL